MNPSRRPAAVNASPTLFETFENRRLCSASLVASIGDGSLSFMGGLSGTILGGGFDFGQTNPIGLPNQSFGLPSRLNTLGNGSIGLPGPGTPLVTAPPFNVRGGFGGSASITGVGSTRFNLAITRQRGGSVTATVALPRLHLTISGKAQATFLGDREFTFAFSRGSDQVEVVARLKKSGAMTGTFAGQLDTRRLDGVFSARRLSDIAG